MSKISVKITTPSPKAIQEKLDKFVDGNLVSQMNSEVVGEIKKLIASGQSPVDGHGRFVQYKDKSIYPAGKKPSSPVNLYLSGEMLSQYKAFPKDNDIFLGYDESTSAKLSGQVQGNNEGTKDLKGKLLGKKVKNRKKITSDNSGVPARRFIPINGETFTISVMRIIKDLYAKRIAALFS